MAAIAKIFQQAEKVRSIDDIKRNTKYQLTE